MATAQRIKDKVVVITGSGTGIGRAEAILFAGEGGRVVVSDVNRETGLETVGLIKKAGGEASFFQADISKSEDARKMMEFAVKTYGRLDILVNNAGISLGGKGDTVVAETPEDIWDKTMNVNLKGTFFCCKYGVQQMLKTGGGTIVNTASLAGVRGRAVVAYGSSKAGIIGLTRSIAVSYAMDNIRANSISPASTMTDQLKGVYGTPEAIAARVAGRIPMGRPAQPEEMAYAALFLACSESSFITGHNLIVDGGETAGFK